MKNLDLVETCYLSLLCFFHWKLIISECPCLSKSYFCDTTQSTNASIKSSRAGRVVSAVRLTGYQGVCGPTAREVSTTRQSGKSYKRIWTWLLTALMEVLLSETLMPLLLLSSVLHSKDEHRWSAISLSFCLSLFSSVELSCFIPATVNFLGFSHFTSSAYVGNPSVSGFRYPVKLSKD